MVLSTNEVILSVGVVRDEIFLKFKRVGNEGNRDVSAEKDVNLLLNSSQLSV
jgi:hypothetical protein